MTVVTKQEINPLFSFFALFLEAKLKITVSYLEMQTRQWWPWARHQSSDQADLPSLQGSNHRAKFGKHWWCLGVLCAPRLLRLHSCVLLEQQLLHVLVKVFNPSAPPWGCLAQVNHFLTGQQVQSNLCCLGGTQNVPQQPKSFLSSVLPLYLQLCLTKFFARSIKTPE